MKCAPIVFAFVLKVYTRRLEHERRLDTVPNNDVDFKALGRSGTGEQSNADPFQEYVIHLDEAPPGVSASTVKKLPNDFVISCNNDVDFKALGRSGTDEQSHVKWV